ncbi:MAG: hypothetical protein J7500_02610 [Sphingomonas sp.]|uniref:hypothetical protein n=1 Tax=Sphingomonas sp. TaxID=28214 RepID=UPI001B2B0ABF|nr:hypothetical protein [Sphingomonas sp.]MBO9621582.1 hypothetical protein [Sphingomonas sp.]
MTFAAIGLAVLACGFAAVTLAFGKPALGPIVVGMDDSLTSAQGAGLLAVTGALLAMALLRLAAMLRSVETGQAFPAAPLRGFACYLFLAVLASVAGPPLIQLAAAAVAGGGRVELGLDGGEVLLLFVTCLLFFVAQLLGDAQAIADDARQIV